MVEGFIATRLLEGVSRGTINRQRALLSRICGVAVEWGYLASNPVKRVRPFREAPSRMRYLTGEEASRLVAAIRSDVRPLILFLLHTGARRGEALALDWSDVDFVRRLVRLRITKNGDSRTVPISASLLATLNAMPRKVGRVFPFTPFGLRRPWRAALKVASLQDFRLHDLRHCAASFAVQGGVPIQAVAQLLGHRSLQMTLKYAHLAPGHLRGAVEAIADATAIWTGEDSAK